MNRLGACASIETLDRYVQYRVEQRLEEGPLAAHSQDSFMFISADNLDFLHSCARVYSGKQQSSWHGTTVQIVQPQPQGLKNTYQQSGGKRPHSVLSPSNSPGKVCSPVPKKLRRMRTGIEKKQARPFKGTGESYKNLPLNSVILY